MNKTQPIFSYASSLCSVISMIISTFISLVYIILLILYEENKLSGDSFISAVPILSWIFLVFPLCIASTIFNVISIYKKEKNLHALRNFILITLATISLPLLFIFALFNIARWP